MKGRSEGLPKNCFREPGASYGMMTAANCAAVHQLEGKAASGEVDRDIGTRDHMRPRQSGCRTNSRFLKWFWRRALEKMVVTRVHKRWARHHARFRTQSACCQVLC
jgi:hypothetical protein